MKDTPLKVGMRLRHSGYSGISYIVKSIDEHTALLSTQSGAEVKVDVHAIKKLLLYPLAWSLEKETVLEIW